MKKLTDSVCRDASCPPGQRGKKLWDGDGLYLWVSDSGRKSWRFNYRRAGASRSLTLGHYPGISLQAAREAAALEKAKLLVNGDYDPAPQNREKKRAALQAAAAAAAQRVTFQQAFEAYAMQRVRVHKWQPMPANLRALMLAGKPLPRGQTRGTTTEHRNRLRYLRHLAQPLGARAINEIEAADLARVLDAVGGGNERRKVKDLIVGTFRNWLALQPLGTSDPCRYMDQLSTQPAHIKGHNAAITDPAEYGLLVRDCCRGLDRNLTFSGAALLTQVYLFQRSGVVESMRWADLHLDAGEWRIPYETMKAATAVKLEAARSGRMHVVPLPEQLVALFRRLREVVSEECPWVFPARCWGQAIKSGRKSVVINGHISEAAMRGRLIRHGYGGRHTPHGCRASAKTILLNWFRCDKDLIKRQMAHSLEPNLAEAYDRRDLLHARKMLIQNWADLVDHLAEGRSLSDYRPRYPQVMRSLVASGAFNH